MHSRVLNSIHAPEARAALERIMRGLTTPAGHPNADHPYRNSYGINFLAVEGDQRLLETIGKTKPELQTEFNTLKNGLEELARQDRRYGIRQYEKFREQPTRTDKMLGGMMQSTALLVGAVGFLVLGVPRIIRGKFPGIGSLLFLTLALSQIPGVRNMFSSKEQQMLKQVDQTANHPLFRSLCRDYAVTGPSWSRYVRRVMSDNARETELAGKLRKNNMKPNGLEKDIDAYIRSSGLGTTEKEDLQRMIDDGRFPDFINALSSVSDSDAQAITQDFVKTGASVYAANVNAAKRTI
jgi:hypothetical protein